MLSLTLPVMVLVTSPLRLSSVLPVRVTVRVSALVALITGIADAVTSGILPPEESPYAVSRPAHNRRIAVGLSKTDMGVSVPVCSVDCPVGQRPYTGRINKGLCAVRQPSSCRLNRRHHP